MSFKNMFYSLQENDVVENKKEQEQEQENEVLVAMANNNLKMDLDNIPAEAKAKGDFWTQDQKIRERKSEDYLTQEQKDELKFMRDVMNSSSMKRQFENSPKKGNIQFNLEQIVEPFSYSYQDGQACMVKGVITQEFGLDYFIPKELKDEVVLNEQEKAWEKELVARHELNHCKFNDLAEPLVLTNDKSLNKKINEVSASNGKNNLTTRVNENFVEVLAVMQMLKEGDSPDFRKFLEKHTIKRDSARLASIDSIESKVHVDIPIALKILMQKDNLSELEKMNPNDNEAMEKKALIIANEATRLSLSVMSKSQRKDIYKTIEDGIESSMNGVLTTTMKDFAKEQFGATRLANFKNLYDEFSSENSITRRAAKIYLEDVSKSNPDKVMEILNDMTELGEVKRGEDRVREHASAFINAVKSNPEKYFGKDSIGVLNKLDSEIVSLGIEARNIEKMSKEDKELLKLEETKSSINEMKMNQTGYLKMSPDFADKLEKIQEGFDSVNKNINVKGHKI